MPAYNPYLFQTLGLTHIKEAAQPETLLRLLGATTAVIAGVRDVWRLFKELAAIDSSCRSFVNTVEECVAKRKFDRRGVEALVMLLIRSGIIDVRRYANVPCSSLNRLLRDKDRVYPQFINDLRRGYVLLSPSDPQACNAWHADVEVKPSILVNAVIASRFPEDLERFDVHRASLILGSLVLVLGVLLRATPLYHMLALALALLCEQPDVCGRNIDDIQSFLLSSSIIGLVAKEVGVDVSRFAEILAKEVRSLCKAIEVLRKLQELRLSLDKLRGVLMHCGAPAESLDPILYLEDVRVLAVPKDLVKREVEVCLSRCKHG